MALQAPNGSTLTNTGTITGGNGGAGGTFTGGGSNGAAGAGGAGITGSGLTIINSGTITGGLGDAGAGARANAISFIGGTNVLTTNGGSYSGAIDIAGGGNLTLAQTTAAGATQNATYSNVFSGAGALAVTAGNGFSVTLSGTNTYTGGTTFGGGTLNVGSAGALGASGTLSFTGGTLQYSASKSTDYSGRFSAAASQAYNIDTNGQAVTYASALTSSGGTLTKLGAGTLTLSAANTYTGGTTLSAGTLALSGAGTLGATTGTLSVSGGTLDLGTTTQTTGALTLTGGTIQNGTLTSSAFGVQAGTVSGILAGAGALTKTGAGTVTLSGANTYTGGTTVTGGTLSVSSDANLGAASGGLTLSGGGTLSTSASFATIRALALGTGGGTVSTASGTTLTESGIVSGAGSLIKAGSGILVLSGQNTFSGGTTIAAGTVRAETNAAFGAGAITTTGSVIDYASGIALSNPIAINSSTTQLSVATGSATQAGAISELNGPRPLEKIGAGTLTLTGANTYTGPTTVTAGTLVVSGSLASAVTVASGASLGGAGTIGALSLPSGATLAPGGAAAFGTLSIAGNVNLALGSSFQVKVDAAGNADRLAASGAASLGGGAVSVLAGAGTYQVQTAYTILTASGGVSGRFGSVFTNLAFLTPTLTYGSNAVGLVLTRNDVPIAAVAATPNQAAVAGAVQASVAAVVAQAAAPGAATPAAAATTFGPTSPLVVALINTSAPQARQAFEALSGQVHAGTVRTLVTDAGTLRDSLLGRLRAGQGFGLEGPAAGLANLSGEMLQAAYAADLPGRRSAPEPVVVRTLDPTVVSLWGEGFGSFGEAYRTANAARLDRTTAGFLAGGDVTFAGIGKIGLAGGYSDARVDADALLSRARVQSGYGAAYGALAAGPAVLRGGLTYAGHAIDTSRAIVFPGFSGSARAKLEGWTAQVFGEVGLPIPVAAPTWSPAAWLLGGPARLTLEPFLGAAGIRVRTGSFAETGGAGAALLGFARDHDIGTLTAGIRAETVLGERGQFVLRNSVGYRAAFGDVDPKALLAFASAAATPFAIGSVPLDRHALVSETSLDWRVTPSTTIGLASTGAYGRYAMENGVKGRFEYRF